MPYKDEKKNKACRASYQKRHPEKARECQRRWDSRHPEKRLWLTAKTRAEKKNLEFSITEWDIVIPRYCPILGLELRVDPRRTNSYAARDNAPSLDRTDPQQGYVPGNVRVVSWRANSLKKDGTLEEFECIVSYLKQQDK